jgi:hypothetical protein
MRLPRNETLLDWVKALGLWLALSISLGLYYRFAENGARGLLLPHPESFVAALFYHFSKASEMRPAVQVTLWLVAMPVIGILWVSLQTLFAKLFDGRRAHFSVSLVRSGAAAAPIAMLGLWLIVRAGDTPSGWQLARVFDVAYGHAMVRPSRYIDYLFAGAAFIALAIELRLFWRAFDVNGNKAVGHFVTALAVLTLAAFGAGHAGAMLLEGTP